MKKIVLLCALACAVMISLPAAAADVGVVFMHGKWGNTAGRSPSGQLVQAIKDAGMLAEFPEMPWSKDRAYDRDVDGALAEIDAAAKRLQDKGAQRIVVGGQSMGANMAFAYAARRDGIAAVLAVSPGHVPESGGFRSSLAPDVGRAQRFVGDGKGETKASFLDINQGERKNLSVTANIYLSWMDPAGAAVMPRNAAGIKPGTALYWIAGDKDGLTASGRAYALDKAPANPKSAYVVITGGAHANTQSIATPQIVAWLKAL